MEQNTGQQIQKNNINKSLYIVFGAIILSLLITISYIFMSLSTKNIHSNIKIMDINVSGISKEEAILKLKERYSNNQNEILELSVGENKSEISFNDLNVIYYIDDAVDSAYKVGRSGGFFTRLKDIIRTNLKGEIIQIQVIYNKEKLNNTINQIEKPILVQPKNDGYEITGNNLIFTYGENGKGIDKNKSIELVEEKIKYGRGDKVVFNIINLESKVFDINSISETPQDASYRVVDNKIEFLPEKCGIIVDKKLFLQLINQNKKDRKSFSIPVKIVEPNIKIKSLEQKIFRDELGSHETNYGNSSASRKENISLAASKIGDIILAPGQEFSYNNIVGPRTPERGFKKAHVYSNGEVIDGYGGGICQTSTTLYNAVIKSKLQIVERKNHIFTVSYAPPGMDATVSYGTIDLVFRNNQDFPIKIVNDTTQSKVKFRVLGTKVDDNITIEYRTETIKTIPYETEKSFDAEMAVGQTKVTQHGQNGYVVNVYKVTKKDGRVISDEFLSRDSYWALKEKVVIGTKPVVIGEEKQQGTKKDKSNNEIIDIGETYIEQNVPVFEQNNPFDF